MESREEKLRRWLEEKKAASKQALNNNNNNSNTASKPPSSSVKRSSLMVSSTPGRELQTPTANGGHSRVLDKTPQTFSRGPTTNTTTTTTRREEKTPQQRMGGWEMKTPQQQRDTAVSEQESMDRRRRLLERTTLAGSTTHTATKSRTQQRTSALPPTQTPVQGSSRKSTSRATTSAATTGDVSASVKRKEAISRAVAEPKPVDLNDLTQFREHMAVMETVLLQWAYMNARLQRTVKKREEQAREQLLLVWRDTHITQEECTALSMEIMREQNLRRLNTQLDAQYRYLLPMKERVQQFLSCYTQLYRTVYSTTHHLPVVGSSGNASAAVGSVQELEVQLGHLKAPLEALLGLQGVQECITYARAVEVLAQLVASEFTVLKKCRVLLVQVERSLVRKRSLLVQLVEQQQQQQQQEHRVSVH